VRVRRTVLTRADLLGASDGAVLAARRVGARGSSQRACGMADHRCGSEREGRQRQGAANPVALELEPRVSAKKHFARYEVPTRNSETSGHIELRCAPGPREPRSRGRSRGRRVLAGFSQSARGDAAMLRVVVARASRGRIRCDIRRCDLRRRRSPSAARAGRQRRAWRACRRAACMDGQTRARGRVRARPPAYEFRREHERLPCVRAPLREQPRHMCVQMRRRP
jgi:hypothetical protein